VPTPPICALAPLIIKVPVDVCVKAALPIIPFLNVLFPVPCQPIGVLTSSNPFMVVEDELELPSNVAGSRAENLAIGMTFAAVPGNHVTPLVAGEAPDVFHSKTEPSFHATTEAGELAKLP